MNNSELENQTNKKTNPLGIKLVAWGCFSYPLLVLLPVILAFLKTFKSFDELSKFLLGGIVWGFTIVIAVWVAFLIVTGVISAVLGMALMKRSKIAYAAILFFSLFLVAFQVIVIYVNQAFKIEFFSLLSIWCVFVIALLIQQRKLF